MSSVGLETITDLSLAENCVNHARTFFDRPDYDLGSAKLGTFAIAPVEGMIGALRRDYRNTAAMIFGQPPEFTAILESMQRLDRALNGK